MHRLALFAVLALSSVAAFATEDALRAEPKPPAYRVIVNPKNPIASAERKFVEEAFLKKTTSWSSGAVIRPVDLVPNAPARRAFSDEVLHRSVAEVKTYWQQAIFAGRDVPPPELGSDEDVIKFVLKYDGAIGYVSGTANLSGAKAIAIQ